SRGSYIEGAGADFRWSERQVDRWHLHRLGHILARHLNITGVYGPIESGFIHCATSLDVRVYRSCDRDARRKRDAICGRKSRRFRDRHIAALQVQIDLRRRRLRIHCAADAQRGEPNLTVALWTVSRSCGTLSLTL